ncbi:MAG TPA: AsmA family protein, partial [Rhizomicrobium sp.]
MPIRLRDAKDRFIATSTRAVATLRAEFTSAPWSWGGALRWAGILLGAFIIALFVTLYYMDWNAMRGPLARYASARLGRPVTIGHLSVRLFTLQPRIGVDGLIIANPSWLAEPHAAAIPHLRIEIRLLPLLRGALVVPLVQAEQPDILVVRDENGRSNWAMPGGASGNGYTLPPIQNFLIDNGHLHIVDRIRKLDFTGTISSHEHADGTQSAFVARGSGTLNGNKVLAEIHGGPLINVDVSKPYVFSADLRAGTSHAVMTGALPHPFHLGQYGGHARFTGADLSDLYYLTGLPMPGTPPYRLSGDLSRDGAVLKLKNLSGIIGWSDLHGDLSLDTSKERPFLSGSLASRSLRFEDLGVLFGRPAKPGRPDAALPAPKPAAPIAAAFILPDVPLHTEHMRHMDVALDYKADKVDSVDFPMRDVLLH